MVAIVVRKLILTGYLVITICGAIWAVGLTRQFHQNDYKLPMCEVIK